MVELCRTTDLVYLSMVLSYLEGAGLSPVVLDTAISAVEGGIGAFPRRVMLPAAEAAEGAALLAALAAAPLDDGPP
jgi:hypothetical protein